MNDKAYIIDFGARSLMDVRKCVTFTKGVGVLDHAGVAVHRPDIYGAGLSVDGKYPRPSGNYARFEFSALTEYFANLGCKVTEVSEAEAARIRKQLSKGELPADKYLKGITPIIKAPEEKVVDKSESFDKGDFVEPGEKSKIPGPVKGKGGKRR